MDEWHDFRHVQVWNFVSFTRKINVQIFQNFWQHSQPFEINSQRFVLKTDVIRTNMGNLWHGPGFEVVYNRFAGDEKEEFKEYKPFVLQQLFLEEASHYVYRKPLKAETIQQKACTWAWARLTRKRIILVDGQSFFSSLNASSRILSAHPTERLYFLSKTVLHMGLLLHCSQWATLRYVSRHLPEYPAFKLSIQASFSA